jgi:hypothetical protein
MATDSMTVKITPNGRGNPMTSTDHRRFSDQEIAQSATPTRIAESSAPEDPAFERHYRIGELAAKWQLGREMVRLLVKDERGVIKIRLGRKKAHAHDLLRARIGRRANPHAHAQQPLVRRFTLIERGASDSAYLRPPEIPTSFGFSL